MAQRRGPDGGQEQDLGLECRPDEAGCTASIGFDALLEDDEPPVDGIDALAQLRRAWKATLAREGKLNDPE
ncbi:MAG: hypothetical protein ACRDZ7_10415 [Acidimicrobiia bacterium]